ncbi:Pycsar system effector family protein [Streptomyces sp. NBC_00258]|uniref:Pycsar system effector family protein n=1 Tax=Streptomyces sp. NBC_00258 TaxID=2903642 RepID=UPI002E2972B5|nr:Pycsar system effector family protein [Streptomyces sp. NBC_00258]
MLSFTGAVLAGLTSLANNQLPSVTRVFGAAGVLALAAASVLLLLVVWPRLGGGDRASFPYWARLTEAEIRACMDGDSRTARIQVALTTVRGPT